MKFELHIGHFCALFATFLGVKERKFLKDLEDFNKDFRRLNRGGFGGDNGGKNKKVLDSFHDMVYSRMCLNPNYRHGGGLKCHII